ncbi:ABC transporter ATP-binding protein [Colwellia sp. 1_MG-2023]|uniref:ABC transporter ATP-binding protein n=1 Tax=Colwellia sp. 1_MG-2023 TaxID=3062649 RepID=UPI0026E45CDC|nr:ABC transporter ATP-binding protein [Colwellia sp. 1_MG-2023]MDO6444439.1 ABC transporter ATP-binding protein [Colwellia sp. 1_MG-2023]
MTVLLTLRQLSVALQQKPILSDVNLTLAEGDILGLVGPSGCGKTTLLNTIAGFVEQHKGSISIAPDMVIDANNLIAPEQRNIGMIFQDYALFPHLSVYKNIAFGLNHIDKAEQATRIDTLLSLLKLTDYSERYPHQLSGGQQQRVAIARALAPQPKLLLLDEPFSNIDARLRNELMLELRSLLKKLGITAIFVTHNKDEVFSFADKIAVMHQGRVLQSGTPIDVFHQPSSWLVADFLQIGSWLPVIEGNDECFTAIGNIVKDTIADQRKDNEQQYLLLKPQHIALMPEGEVNVNIEYVRITEHGFHYLLSSLTDDKRLSFEQLSFYSHHVFAQGEKIAIEILPHNYQLFSK